MGCDIHSVAQVKKDGKWTTVQAQVGGDQRDYHSFAVMADVRNGSGFAGTLTSEPWPVIAEPRGLPEDLEVKGSDVETPTWFSRWDKLKTDPRNSMWLGDHSHSFLSLKEMEDFYAEAKNKSHIFHGVVERAEYEAMLAEGRRVPNEYCSDVMGPNIVKVIPALIEATPNYTHVQTSWKKNVCDSLYTLKEYLEELNAIALKQNVEKTDIRLVFGFDS